MYLIKVYLAFYNACFQISSVETLPAVYIANPSPRPVYEINMSLYPTCQSETPKSTTGPLISDQAKRGSLGLLLGAVRQPVKTEKKRYQWCIGRITILNK